jgi:hypothetical protein
VDAAGLAAAHNQVQVEVRASQQHVHVLKQRLEAVTAELASASSDEEAAAVTLRAATAEAAWELEQVRID